MTYRLPDPLPPPPPYWQPSKAFVRALVVLAAFGLGCPELDDDELDDELDDETETGGDPCPVDCYVVGDPDADIVQCFCPTSSS